MKWITLALALLATPTYAQYVHRSNPGTLSSAGGAVTTAGAGNCPGTGCFTVSTQGASTMTAVISGTWNQTLQFSCSNDGWATVTAIAADTITSGVLTGSPSPTTTANGTFVMPTYGMRECGIFATIFTSNTSMSVRLDADPATPFAVTQPIPSLGFQNDAVTTVVQIKGTMGIVYEMSGTNTTAATAYVQVFCKPSASVTLGTTLPDYVIRLKTNAGAGDERDIPFPFGLCNGGTGISVAGTTTATGLTTAAVSVSAAFL